MGARYGACTTPATYNPYWAIEHREASTLLAAQKRVFMQVESMATRELARGEWRRYCDQVSKALVGKRAELEVVSLELGDHVAAKWLPLLGVVYDPRADIFEIALEGIGHSIREPREVYVEETPRGLVALEILAADETRQILRLREPLAWNQHQAQEVTS